MSATPKREPLYRKRPGAEAIAAATDAPAIDLGDGIWMSSGLSNAYLLRTSAGRVIVNCGMGFEGPHHRAAFDAVDPSPTHTIILTQGHPDHLGGVDSFREPATRIVTHENFRIFRDDFERLMPFRQRNSAFAWASKLQAVFARAGKARHELPPQSRPEPTQTFTDELELVIGGRRLTLLSTPGGETTDACVVWLPESRTLLSGNVLGPLFGHVPNLVTVRGDRYRDALDYVASVDRLRALKPARMITGHFDPIDGEDLIEDELRRLRDATQWVHDRVVEGMNAGTDVHAMMRDVRLPPDLEVGEGYGKTAWNVRAIRETYAGWFHHRSTTELYATPFSAVAPDLVRAAGADALVEAARRRLDAGEPVEAIHVTDVVLAAEPENAAARRVAADAHAALLARATNFWERAWLKKRLGELGGSGA
ncbi:MAG: MBL fold metallo-hydrolase [Deltaproteobacteria bacterium]|nr:MBL fold metallo-hydrolase [Deltaproteobacteria bacterium]